LLNGAAFGIGVFHGFDLFVGWRTESQLRPRYFLRTRRNHQPHLQDSFRRTVAVKPSNPLLCLSPAAHSRVAIGANHHRVTSALPPRLRQRFEQDGYLVLPQFCTTSEVAWLRAILVRLFDEHIGREQGSQFDMLGPDVEITGARQPQILKPAQFVPELLHASYVTRTARIARQLLGPDAQLSFDHSILKPAGSASATPWHQDEAHQSFRFLRYPQISCWLALQDTALENGCMRYVPGSHRGPLLPHRRLNEDPRIHAIECPTRHFDEALAVAVPVAAGSCILHSALTLHSALPNVSAQDRIAYIVAFTGPPVPVARGATRTSMRPGCTANLQRRHRWLLRGGFVPTLAGRLLRALHASPRALWLKLQALWRASVAPEGRVRIRIR
jgi:ectoine hydroxylase-related dioxygenase (phytanoyl-CoA dioxygenase family)